MSTKFLPDGDRPLETWAQNCTTVATNNLTQLKMTTLDLKPFTDALTAYSTSLTDLEAKLSAYRASVTAKQTAKSSLEKEARAFNARVQQTSGVSDALKNQLRLNIHRAPAKSTPNVPTDLVVNGYQTGINRLKWSANGNIRGTLFVIEAQYPNSTEWQSVETILATRFDHTGQTPGVQVKYRVRAKRRTEFSPYSNVVPVYGNDSSSELKLQKAA